MRHLAIDYGTRRVGLALSDAGGTWVTALEVVEVTAMEQAVDAVAVVAEREGVERLVVGYPLNMDGTPGAQARLTRRFGEALAAKTGLPMVYVDERLSSFDAEQQLAGRRRQGEKLTRKRKKQQRDAVAAATFLRGLLDGELTPLDVTPADG